MWMYTNTGGFFFSPTYLKSLSLIQYTHKHTQTYTHTYIHTHACACACQHTHTQTHVHAWPNNSLSYRQYSSARCIMYSIVTSVNMNRDWTGHRRKTKGEKKRSKGRGFEAAWPWPSCRPPWRRGRRRAPPWSPAPRGGWRSSTCPRPACWCPWTVAAGLWGHKASRHCTRCASLCAYCMQLHVYTGYMCI